MSLRACVVTADFGALSEWGEIGFKALQAPLRTDGAESKLGVSSGGESGIGVGCAPTARAFSVAASSSLIPSAVVVAWVG